MKKMGIALWVMIILVLLSGVALADCAQDCQDTYATCMKYCSQDTCRLSCIRGLNGCLKRCRGKDPIGGDEESYLPSGSFVQLAEINCVCAECGYKCGSGHATTCSSYQKPKAKTPIIDDLEAENANNIVLAANCIEKDLQCTLNGTPCCAPYECKGKFPNTYCQEK